AIRTELDALCRIVKECVFDSSFCSTMLYLFLMLFLCSVHPVLEFCQALHYYNYHSWRVWRWPVGLRDL
uniref:Uncharacterized protein n=1 Tax=Aegilops tauschii subsp. strangulata TaxID=200361 RepID=A0A453JIT2_AEGTS